MFDVSWYITLDGETLGPLTPAQLHVFVELGWVRPETPVKHQRMRRFVPAREVHGLLVPAMGKAVGGVAAWVWPAVAWTVFGVVVFLAVMGVGRWVMGWCGG